MLEMRSGRIDIHLANAIYSHRATAVCGPVTTPGLRGLRLRRQVERMCLVKQKRALVVLLAVVTMHLQGCASTRYEPEVPAFYRAPDHVSAEDKEECMERAKEETQHMEQKIAEAYDGDYLVQSAINATIGVLTGAWRLPHRKSNRTARAGRRAYADVMKSCLLAKGYSL